MRRSRVRFPKAAPKARNSTGGQFGDRWNPRDIFPNDLPLQPISTSAAELERLGAASGTTFSSLLARGYQLHTIVVTDVAVLDLRNPKALAAVGPGDCRYRR
jgi:hypothetical protein